MRILLVTETLTAGGAETFVIRLANALAGEHAVTIAVLHGELVHQALIDRTSGAVRIERLHLPMKRQWFRADGLCRRLGIDRSAIRAAQERWLSGLVRQAPPDVIHSHLLKADLVATKVRARFPATRHVLTFHGDYEPYWAGHADPQLLDPAPLMAWIANLADGIAAICKDHLDFVAAHFPAAAIKTRLIYNGYAPPQTTPIARRTGSGLFTFGMVSRGVEKKGWRKAIAAFATLPSGSARLILVGEGAEIDRLRREAMPEGVRFVGFSSNPTEWIEQFDVALLPTEFPHESLPTVVMEYLSCGKAVIATDVGEIGEMIRARDGELAGTLLDFDGDCVDTGQLAGAMKAYLDHPELRRLHESRTAAAFAKFDMDLCARAYATLYADLLADATNSSTAAVH